MGIGFKDASNNGRVLIRNQRGHTAAFAVSDFGQRIAVGGRTARPGPQGKAVPISDGLLHGIDRRTIKTGLQKH